MSELSVNDVIGRSLKVKLPVEIFMFNSANQTTESAILQPGRVTPPVDSYLEKDGKLFWVFQSPFPLINPHSVYLEHYKNAFDLLPPVNPKWSYTGFNWTLPAVDVVGSVKKSYFAVLGLLLLLVLVKIQK